jgi:hypothetical protein
MTARASQSDLQLIRLDGDAIRNLPDPVRHAAEIIAAYVAGLDRGLNAAARPGQSRPDRLPIPPTDPADVPGLGAAAPAAVRQKLDERADSRLADVRSTIAAGDSDPTASLCMSIVEIPVPGEPEARTPSAAPEILLVWGADTYRRFSDQQR